MTVARGMKTGTLYMVTREEGAINVIEDNPRLCPEALP